MQGIKSVNENGSGSRNGALEFGLLPIQPGSKKEKGAKNSLTAEVKEDIKEKEAREDPRKGIKINKSKVAKGINRGVGIEVVCEY